MKPTERTFVEELARLFTERGASMYAGEPVTQTEHALQCAWQAERAGCAPATITAALLHDVGHLLHELGEDCADEGLDDRHEQLGAQWLETWFGPEVSEPVRLHVSAKRYRCLEDADYLSKLSPASLQSLQLQGGAMTKSEAAAFREHPCFEQALQLRTWDEAAKRPGLATPPISHFLKHVEACAR